MMIIVSDHAVTRFRERFPGLCRNNPTDESVRGAIVACLAEAGIELGAVEPGFGGRETLRTRTPFALRVMIQRFATRIEVITVLPSGKTKRYRARQKARRSSQREAACSPS